jgi:hypothetical protein
MIIMMFLLLAAPLFFCGQETQVIAAGASLSFK